MPLESGDALSQRLHEGDRQALSEAFTAHRERLWRMINFRMDRRLRGRVDPDDILQEAYLNAEHRLAHFRNDASHSLFIWFRLIVSQTLVDVHRRHVEAGMRDANREVSMNHSPRVQSTSVSLAEQLAGSMTSPSHAAHRQEVSRQLIAALETMDPIDQEIIALRHFEDLSNADVAEVLDIKRTAASNRYVRAIARFRDVLDRLPGFSESSGGRNIG
jgi:RNA polymerase sigma-70 factor (ECF subfamily)